MTRLAAGGSACRPCHTMLTGDVTAGNTALHAGLRVKITGRLSG
jgi:hypothetical protein